MCQVLSNKVLGKSGLQWSSTLKSCTIYIHIFLLSRSRLRIIYVSVYELEGLFCILEILCQGQSRHAFMRDIDDQNIKIFSSKSTHVMYLNSTLRRCLSEFNRFEMHIFKNAFALDGITFDVSNEKSEACSSNECFRPC